MEKHFLNHMLKISGCKIDDQGNGFIDFHYEGNLDDCVTVVEELEKCAKRLMKKLGKK